MMIEDRGKLGTMGRNQVREDNESKQRKSCWDGEWRDRRRA